MQLFDPAPRFTVRLSVLCSLIIMASALVGCDFFKLETESSIVEGRWSSNVVPSAGNCCGIDLTLDSDDELISGRGVIKVPGSRVGDELQFSVEVTGTFRDERLELESTSQANPVFIQGILTEDTQGSNALNLLVNFEGFGFTARDILLFHR